MYRQSVSSQIAEVVLGMVEGSKSVQLLNMDATSYLVLITYKDNHPWKGARNARFEAILYRPGLFGPDYDIEIADKPYDELDEDNCLTCELPQSQCTCE